MASSTTAGPQSEAASSRAASCAVHAASKVRTAAAAAVKQNGFPLSPPPSQARASRWRPQGHAKPPSRDVF